MYTTQTTTDRWYRSPRGDVFGVCTGLAEWRGLDAHLVRVIVFLTILFTGFFPGALIYLVMALILPKNPEGQRVYTTYTTSDDDKERDWDNRFNTGRN